MNIDREKLKQHPLTIIVARIQASIMALRENQIALIKVVANDLGYPEELLTKSLMSASKDVENNLD